MIAAYWRDYEGHRNEFMPAYLANDILRLWRTFCVNYEARTSTEPAEKKAKRKLKNYKLKHSRLLTCYSALIYLLAVYAQRGTVSPDDAAAMIRLTPTGRLLWLAEQKHLSGTRETVENLLGLYEAFLSDTEAPESEMIAQFLDRERSKRLMESASFLGDCVFDLLGQVGRDNRLYRLLLV